MQLPQVEIVDMKRELRRGNGTDISESCVRSWKITSAAASRAYCS